MSKATNALSVLKKNLTLVELKELSELIEDYVEVECQKDMANDSQFKEGLDE